MELLSKELLSAVLGERVFAYSLTKDKPNMITILANNLTRDVNIYELAHKVKEWMSDKYPNFSIKWANHKAVGTENFQVRVWLYNECIGKADTEPEALFKAGEWVLKELDK